MVTSWSNFEPRFRILSIFSVFCQIGFGLEPSFCATLAYLEERDITHGSLH